MNTVDFVKDIPADQIASIFKDYFEQHMLVYDMLRGVNFISLNSITFDKASIIYSVTLGDENKEKLVERLRSECGSLVIYNKRFTPEIYLNGDLLCITIKK
jgi:hypothetical protein